MGQQCADPFYNNAAAGQASLSTAIVDPKGKQLYNIHDGKIVTFQPDGVGGYHSYYASNTNKEVPNNVLREMRNKGLISNVQYRKFIHNK